MTKFYLYIGPFTVRVPRAVWVRSSLPGVANGVGAHDTSDELRAELLAEASAAFSAAVAAQVAAAMRKGSK